MALGAQGLEPPSVAFLDLKQEVRLGMKQLEHGPVPMWDASAMGKGLTYSIMVAASESLKTYVECSPPNFCRLMLKYFLMTLQMLGHGLR